MNRFALAIFAVATCAVTSVCAHDLNDEIAQFNQMYATKNLESNEAKAAKVLFERSQGLYLQAEEKILLKVRSLTNNAFKELGEQPAFLTSELKRLDAAIAAAKTTDPAKLAKAKQFAALAKAEKAAYDTVDKDSSDDMKQALKLLASAPSK